MDYACLVCYMQLKRYFIFPRLFPITVLVFTHILGIIAAYHCMPIPALICGGFSMLLLARFLSYYTSLDYKKLYSILYSLAFLGGAYNHIRLYNQYEYFYSYVQDTPITVTGSVKDILAHSTKKIFGNAIDISITSIERSSDHREITCHGTLRLYVRSIRSIRIADTIKVTIVQCKKPATKLLHYCVQEGILGTALVDSYTIILLQEPKFSLRRWIAEYKMDLLERFRQQLSRPTFNAFASIFLGYKPAKKEATDLKNTFRLWGLSHYLARAGLHLVLFVSLWGFLMGLLPIHAILRSILMLFLCILYALFSWHSIPFMRAFYALIITRACSLSYIRTYQIPVLSLVALVTLLENPAHVFALDFQLSFGITYVLGLFNEITKFQKNRVKNL